MIDLGTAILFIDNSIVKYDLALPNSGQFEPVGFEVPTAPT
jgi:hypothetical protein